MPGRNSAADILDAAGTHDFFDTLVCWIGTYYPHQFAIATVNPPKLSCPILLIDPITNSQEMALKFFTQATYLLNPIYWHQINLRKPTIVKSKNLDKEKWHTLRELADSGVPIIPDNREWIGYRTENWPKHLDETSLLFPIHDDHSVTIILFREQNISKRVNRSTIDLWNSLAFVAAAIRHHTDTPYFVQFLNRKKHGTSVLTPTQIEVFRWWVAGKTLSEIATIMGMKRRTVRYHMERVRNIYGYSTIQQTGVRVAQEYGLDPMGKLEPNCLALRQKLVGSGGY